MKMTVRELKQILSDMPDDAPVLILDADYAEYYVASGAWEDEVYLAIDNDVITFKADVFVCEEAEFAIAGPEDAKNPQILAIEASINE
jgi:hypothetical protein